MARLTGDDFTLLFLYLLFGYLVYFAYPYAVDARIGLEIVKNMEDACREQRLNFEYTCYLKEKRQIHLDEKTQLLSASMDASYALGETVIWFPVNLTLTGDNLDILEKWIAPKGKTMKCCVTGEKTYNVCPKCSLEMPDKKTLVITLGLCNIINSIFLFMIGLPIIGILLSIR